jgi:hypothetical protein|tara:strand:+ start:812 stop:1345 length:534 start_codon:yes stop_codon:yes gene_type:complete
MQARFATLKDLKYVNHLSKKESKSLGFIPNPAYESAITGIKTGKRWSNVCNDKLWVLEENKDLVGFLLMSFGTWSKVNQIAIQEDARLIERGKELLTQGITYGKNIGRTDFVCGCADDLPSNSFWSGVGWKQIGKRKGISHKNTWKETSKRTVNIYNYQLNSLFFDNKDLLSGKNNG